VFLSVITIVGLTSELYGQGANIHPGVLGIGAAVGALVGWPAMLFWTPGPPIPLQAQVSQRWRLSACRRIRRRGGGLVLIVLNAAFGGLQSEQAFAAGVGTSIIFGPLISVIASWLFWRRPELDAPQPDLVAAKFE
jgi:hypothetical protein